jgi:ABC-type transport system substrate-binding protein
MRGWPEGEAQQDAVASLACLKRGGWLWGVFDGPALVAAVVGAASMAGVPLMLGFVAKEAAYEAFVHGGLGGPDGVVLAGLVVPATGILPPGFPAYNPNLKGYDYDPVKARKLLDESQYGPGKKPMPLILLTTSGSFGADVGLDLEIILEMWKKNLGIEVQIQQTEFATYLQDLIKRRFQMFQIGWIADYPDPENVLDVLFHSKSKQNNTRYMNPELDAKLEAARIEPDTERRLAMYQEIEKQLIDEAVWVPMYFSTTHALIKPYVKNYIIPPAVIERFRDVEIDR